MASEAADATNNVTESAPKASTKSKKKKKSTKSSRDKATKSPYEWTVDEVAAWIASIDYRAQSKKFKTASIDGSKLFTLNRTTLQHTVKVFDGMQCTNTLHVHIHIDRAMISLQQMLEMAF